MEASAMTTSAPQRRSSVRMPGILRLGLVILVLAALWLDRRLVQAALVGYLAYEVPHLVYHLANDHRLSAGDHAASDISLGLSAVLALVLLTLTRGPGAAR